MSVLHVFQIVKMETNRANHLSSQKSEKKSYYSRESTTFEKHLLNFFGQSHFLIAVNSITLQFCNASRRILSHLILEIKLK